MADPIFSIFVKILQYLKEMAGLEKLKKNEVVNVEDSKAFLLY